MKKILIVVAIFMIIYVVTNDKKDYYVIPDDAIRFRIVANSNSIYDQYIKNKVKNNLEQSFLEDINKSNTIEETRTVINNNVDKYKSIISNVFEEEQYNKDFYIDYGMNYFPEKIYKDVKYEEGNYESLLVTIGEGKGDNFWCLLFPPICTLEVEEKANVEYKFFIKEVFDKYILNN